ncbi:MAG: RNA polymerase subunit sigma-70 [Lachnospiraceae bacterium]|jgi:RNA polymerase sigma-70 factor (ECF subfamily)|nr:RNA polymerase subunit sigma-70 [Lachnospiraceae bacterium]
MHTQTEAESNSEIFSVVMELEKNYRVPFVLFYVEGFSVKEISQMLGLTQSTVKTRLYRGRNLVKKSLTEGRSA